MTWQEIDLAKIYFAEPDRLRLLAFCSGFFILCLAAWILRISLRLKRTSGSRHPVFGTWRFWFFLIASTPFLIGAFAKPFTTKGLTVAKKSSVEAIFIIDSSSSMFLKDTGWSRIDIATREIAKLISSGAIRPGDRVALFLAGSIGSRRYPFTKDLDGFADQVSKVKRPKDFNSFDGIYWSSDMGEALQHIYQRIDRQDMADILGVEGWDDNWKPRVKANRFAILISDGDFFGNLKDNSQGLADAQKKFSQSIGEFQKRGIEIYSVGVGTARYIPLVDILQDYRAGVDYPPSLADELKDNFSMLNTDTLAFMSSATGGQGPFVIQSVKDNSVIFLSSAIDKYRSKSLEPYLQQEKRELWPYFIFVALALFIAGLGRYFALAGVVIVVIAWIAL